jgi:8-oxo-dGTP pyrophosphatase MutT (NUDIX family)
MTAVRETFEETGLILGRRAPVAIQTRSPSWKPFFDTGFAPALDRLDYVARAITPPQRVRRFDARFFLVDADHLHGELVGNGELEDLHWAPIGETGRLKLSPITALILELLQDRLTGRAPAGDAIPFFRYRHGKDSIEYEQ